MPFWNTEKLREQCLAKQLITPYRPERAIRCAYELGVGPEAFITSNPRDNTHVPAGTKIIIPPGQFGLLITKEIVFVPPEAIAFISIRARIKFKGLVNVSGFHVDPGFRGTLKFAVYNAGSDDIILDQDERVFMIWYADLNAPAPDPYPAIPETPSVITAEDISKIQGDVASPGDLKIQIDGLRSSLDKQVEELKGEIDKKFHVVEQSRLITRWLVTVLITAVISVGGTLLVRTLLDGGKAAQPSGTDGSKTSPPAKDRPEEQNRKE